EAFNASLKIENNYFRLRASDSVIKALAKAGKTEEALDAARKYDSEYLRSHQRLPERQQADRQFASGYMLSQTLAIVVEARTNAGKTEEALNAARMIEDIHRRDVAMVKVIEALANAGKIEEALNAALEIEEKYRRDNAMIKAIEVLAKAGK